MGNQGRLGTPPMFKQLRWICWSALNWMPRSLETWLGKNNRFGLISFSVTLRIEERIFWKPLYNSNITAICIDVLCWWMLFSLFENGPLLSYRHLHCGLNCSRPRGKNLSGTRAWFDALSPGRIWQNSAFSSDILQTQKWRFTRWGSDTLGQLGQTLMTGCFGDAP